MTGLENIIKKIESDSNDKCGEIISEAQKKAEDIRARAIDEAQKSASNVLASAQEKAARINELADKRIAQNEKSELLKAKVNAIDSVIDSALSILNSLPDERYFAVLLKLISTHAQSGEGLIILNSRDLARLPEDFEEEAKKEGLNAGAELSVSDKAENIKNGLLLKYGDIEINCTFDALIDEKRDELKEKVNSILFMG